MKEEMEKMGGRDGSRPEKVEMKEEMEKMGKEVEIDWIGWK